MASRARGAMRMSSVMGLHASVPGFRGSSLLGAKKIPIRSLSFWGTAAPRKTSAPPGARRLSLLDSVGVLPRVVDHAVIDAATAVAFGEKADIDDHFVQALWYELLPLWLASSSASMFAFDEPVAGKTVLGAAVVVGLVGLLRRRCIVDVQCVRRALKQRYTPLTETEWPASGDKVRRLVAEHLEANPAFKSLVLVDGTKSAKRRLDEALYGRDRVIVPTIGIYGLARDLSEELNMKRDIYDIQSVAGCISSAVQLFPVDKKPAVLVLDLVTKDPHDVAKILRELPLLKESIGTHLVVFVCVSSADCVSSLPLPIKSDLVVLDCQSAA